MTRGIPMGRDCISPPGHSAFSTPIELVHFIGRLRELSQGKPVGFKLCVGQPWEFMAIVKAMLKTGILPDYIVVDGAERSEEHTSELQSLMRISYAVFCLKKKIKKLQKQEQ